MNERVNFHDFLTVKEAALFLGVSKGTIRKWDNESKIQSVRHPINRYRLFETEELRKILWILQRRKKL